MRNFALMGVGGYIAPRHMKAIYETGNRLVAAVDPNDSVGVLDKYSLTINYFREPERFDRHLFKLQRKSEEERVQYVSICTPNYLHDAHIRLVLRNGAHAICEKPLVINPWNLDGLKQLEEETGKLVYTVLQLRLIPSLIELKRKIASHNDRVKVELTYITGRGKWYFVSWKGSESHSGGIATNIGIHLFDLMLWLFGPAHQSEIYFREAESISGFISMERADVSWFLSLDPKYIPEKIRHQGKNTFRSIKVEGSDIEFSEGFADLHTKVYEEILNGKGYGIEEARASISFVNELRKSEIKASMRQKAHPLLFGGNI
jgi:UDP-N-acetyl-2-amino-2-deoxyglucuronate dehydrogenase